MTEKLEKLYQLVKKERRTASERMIRFRSNVPTKTDGARELEKPAEDFRKFKEGNSDVAVLIDLFFRGIRPAWGECRDERDRFVIRWYMDVQILPLGYIGRIIETGDIYLTVRLASGTLVLCRPHIVKAVQRGTRLPSQAR